jgi:hypothetical protein
MVALRNFHIASTLTAITNGPLDLGIWNLMRIEYKHSYKLSIKYSSYASNGWESLRLYPTNLTQTGSAGLLKKELFSFRNYFSYYHYYYYYYNYYICSNNNNNNNNNNTYLRLQVK